MTSLEFLLKRGEGWRGERESANGTKDRCMEGQLIWNQALLAQAKPL